MNLILKPSFIRFVLLWKKKYKLIIAFNIFYNLFCFRIFLRTKIFGVSLRFYLQIRTEMARNSYHPWKVIRSNIDFTYTYMSYAIFQNQKTSFSMVLPIGILCLTCDLDIDLQFIYRYITLKTSMDHILIIFPQHINILYTLYSGIQRKTTLYGSQKLTSTMMPMPSEYLSILQIFL